MIVQNMTSRAAQILFAVIVLLCAVFSHSQVTVAIAPNPHPQFLDASGKPLASGFLFTYTAGTTSNLNTYVDSSGTIQNPDPIPLDVSGAPSNGSTQTGIWLANTAYKFCAYNAAMVLQWCTDNVTGYLGLLNLPNVWSFQQTFSLPIVDTATDNQLVFGSPGNQTTFDLPPPTGNVTLHSPNTNDTLVGRATTDTLLNKTLTAPVLSSPVVNGCAIINGPGSYFCIANQNPTGTTIGTLTKFVNAPLQAQIAAITDTSGIAGVCVSGCGNSANATIQQSGQVSCVFDGSTIAGDYVGISPSVGGSCHDMQAQTFPFITPANGSLTIGQVLGRVLTTNVGIGTYPIELTGLEVNNGFQQGCNLTPLAADPCGFDSANLVTNQSSSWTPPSGQIEGFRVACYVIVTQAATTSSTMPSCSVGWTDQNSNVAQTLQLTATSAGNTTTTFAQAMGFIAPKFGTTVTFSTAGYVSSGATPMQYAVHFRILPN